MQIILRTPLKSTNGLTLARIKDHMASFESISGLGATSMPWIAVITLEPMFERPRVYALEAILESRRGHFCRLQSG